MSVGHESQFFRWLVRHWIATYILMGMGFVLFGAASLNLVQMFSANIAFLSNYGLDAIQDGALMQLAELVFSTYIAVAFYLLFKTCEHALVQRVAHHPPPIKP
jgi:hypothetical protein